MDELDDINAHNDNVEHDMWVDYDHYMNTGEPDCFDDDDCSEEEPLY